MRNGARERHNEDNGAAHADAGIKLLGNAQERADGDELHENVVLREDHAEHDFQYFFEHQFFASLSFSVQPSALPQPAQPPSPQPISGTNFLPFLDMPSTSIAMARPNMKNPPGVWEMMRMVYSSGMI